MKNQLNQMKYFLLTFAVPCLSFAAEMPEGVSKAAIWSFAVPFAALALGIAAFGGALAQGKIAASFMEGVSRNPQSVGLLKTQLILCLVLVETLVLFTLLISLIIVSKLLF